MKVAVIIVNYNDAEQTVSYVNKIKEYKNIQRIVVVDNLSTEINTMAILRSINNDKVIIIQSDRNGGYSYGNNFGINYLKKIKEEYDYIIISNADIEVEEKAIDKCLQVLENDESAGIVAPRMYNSDNQPIRRSSWKIRTFFLDVVHSTRLLELLFYKKLRNGEYSNEEYENDILQVEAISGAFFVIRYKAFEKAGFFDENVFLFYEEDILAKKMQENNYKIFSINDEKFIHYESKTIGKTFNYYHKMRQLYKSKMYYHKNYNKINYLQIFVFQFLNLCRKIELIIEIPIRKMLQSFFKL